MKITDKAVVSIHYTLTADDGNVIDSSRGKNPLNYLHGSGNIISGLEKALTGKAVGESLKVTVKPEEGYGLVDPQLLQVLPLSAFTGIDDLREGLRLEARNEHGHTQAITVRTITDDGVTIDGNHPLAGQTLHFDVSITAIRAATSEELDHGHVH
ncbi:MAG: peptidylprolyl isomerase [Candidatus Neomarinimicrobiota bacterium]